MPIAPQAEVQVKPETRHKLGVPWKVILHNDPVNTVVYVCYVLRKIFGYSLEKAMQHTMEVHRNKSSVVWSGAKERAEFFVQELHKYQLTASLSVD